ncbi:hypothetical protein N7508_007471 [Penicillium antarcticum]|uniref:uncharacterized protein n=1 Tax=Penicillium antarcticum TaxID=416450 RepID=UPI0023A0BEBA|nr:uncharacterized protein N7508_007471 [Penicillium antarcticum]KAJ5300228.1 hypothetical protein N7508_007471 [Penicillium antarcticum]
MPVGRSIITPFGVVVLFTFLDYNCSQATATAHSLPETQSPEWTESPSDQSTAASTTQRRPGQCKKNKEKRRKRRWKQAQQLQVEHEQLEIQNEQLGIQNKQLVIRNEQLVCQQTQGQIENQGLREQLRQQEQFHRRYERSMRKFFHDCHVEASSIVKSVNILLSDCATRPRGVPEPVRWERRFAHDV